MENHHLKILSRVDLSKEALPSELQLSSEGQYSTYYAPFEFINSSAKLVVCGITPGLQQALIALRTAKAAIGNGVSMDGALKEAKHKASFAGSMRKNLIAMLDFIGLNNWLKLESCADLFSHRQDLIHFTSALRNPVFENGKNYSGGTAMVRNAYLWDQIEQGLCQEILALPESAMFIPLGRGVDKVFEALVVKGAIDGRRVLFGLPHPSGANGERVAYFLNRKAATDLSPKTNAVLIDDARKRLVQKIDRLCSTESNSENRGIDIPQSTGNSPGKAGNWFATKTL